MDVVNTVEPRPKCGLPEIRALSTFKGSTLIPSGIEHGLLGKEVTQHCVNLVQLLIANPIVAGVVRIP